MYLSIELEAKWDIYNTFDPDKPFNTHLDPPSTEHHSQFIIQPGEICLYLWML